jgi:hypothetical protein
MLSTCIYIAASVTSFSFSHFTSNSLGEEKLSPRVVGTPHSKHRNCTISEAQVVRALKL